MVLKDLEKEHMDILLIFLLIRLKWDGMCLSGVKKLLKLTF